MSASETPGGLTVAVLGATGAVGTDLLRALELSPLPVQDWRLFGGPAGRVSSVEVAGQSRKVQAVPQDPETSPLFEEVDLAFFATPPELTRRLAPPLARAGTAVIDIGAALADMAPLFVPAAGRADLDRFAEGRVACIPSAPALLLSVVLAPLLGLGVAACRATVLLSAGVAGRAGVEELSGQVVALFNSQDPPRRVFASGLAFDLVAQVGEVDRDSGRSAVEARVVSEVAAVTGLDPSRFVATVVLAPLFSGVAASLHLDFAGEVGVGAVRAALEAGRRLRVGDPVPGPRRLAGKGNIHVGRLRADPLGDGVHLWAAADNLRAGASANAVETAALLWREGLI